MTHDPRHWRHTFSQSYHCAFYGTGFIPKSTRWPPEFQALLLKWQNSCLCFKLYFLLYRHPGQILRSYPVGPALDSLSHWPGRRHMTIPEPITVATEWASLNNLTNQGSPLSWVWSSAQRASPLSLQVSLSLVCLLTGQVFHHATPSWDQNPTAPYSRFRQKNYGPFLTINLSLHVFSHTIFSRYTINLTLLKCTIHGFNILRLVQLSSLNSEYFHHPQRKPHTLYLSFSVSPGPQLLETTNFSTDFYILEFSKKWNHTIFGLFVFIHVAHFQHSSIWRMFQYLMTFYG